MHISREEVESYFLGELPDDDIPRVESHLEDCEVCAAVYEQLEGERDRLGVLQDLAPDGDPRQPPFTLGDYVCLEEIGKGGFGVVYRAWDAKLNRDVAVKIIRPQYVASAEMRARFRREAELAARCHHANIVWIIRLDEEYGELYFSMEYLKGGSLKDRLTNGKTLPPKEAAELLKTLATAVDFAHRRTPRILHRDLKPANILFTDDDPPIPKIADFGLARGREGTGITEEGLGMGTPGYSAPEQTRGASSEIGPASDIYSLGAILHECLIGVPRGPAPEGRLRHVADRDLAAVCLKCLEDDARRRYATAADLSADLGRWLDGVPLHRENWVERCLRACRHNPWAAAVFGVSLTIIFVALLMVSCSRIRLSEALAQSERAGEELRAGNEQFRRAASALQLHKAASIVDSNPGLAEGMLDNKLLCPHDLRDWSWRYLRALCLQELEAWEHETEPLCMDCCPKRRLFATGDQEGSVRLWQFGAGVSTSLDLAERFRGAVTGVVFSAEGRWVLGSSKDGTARIWDVTDLPDAKCIAWLDPKADQINGVAFSPSRDYFATAHRDKKVRIWRTPSELAKDSQQTLAEPVAVLTGFGESVAQIAYTSDGRFLVCGSDDAQVRVWKTENWEALVVTEGHSGAVKSVAAHPDPGMSSVFATGGQDRRVLLWRIVGGSLSEPKELLRFDESVSSLDFDGENLAAASLDGSVQVCNFARAASEPRRISHATEVLSLAFGHEGDLLSGARDGKVRRWRNGAGGNPLVFSAHSEGVQGINGLVFAADGRTLATGGQDGEVRLWSMVDGKSLGKLGSFAQPVAGMACCKDRSRLLWNVAGRTFVVSNWASGAMPTALDLGLQVPSDLGLSGSGDRLFMGFLGDFGAGLKAWPIPSVREVWQPGIEGQVVCLSIATDATQGVASSEADVWWFDFMAEVTKTIELAPRMESHKVASLAISPDGRLVAIGTDAGTICLYDARQSRHLGTVSGHAERVRCLAFSPDPDNGTLASGGEDGHVRLWDAEMGFERLALRTRQPVDVVAFSRDASQLAAGCRDGSVHVWRCNSD